MEFKDLIDALGKKLGLELEVSAEGDCTLGVDDMTLTIQHLEEVDVVAVWGKIASAPPQGQEQLYAAMLEANHLFKGTGGATISREQDSGDFFLCRVDEMKSLDSDQFVDRLERFVNTLEAWQKLVADYRPDLAGASYATSEAEPGVGLGGGMFMSV